MELFYIFVHNFTVHEETILKILVFTHILVLDTYLVSTLNRRFVYLTESVVQALYIIRKPGDISTTFQVVIVTQIETGDPRG